LRMGLLFIAIHAQNGAVAKIVCPFSRILLNKGDV